MDVLQILARIVELVFRSAQQLLTNTFAYVLQTTREIIANILILAVVILYVRMVGIAF